MARSKGQKLLTIRLTSEVEQYPWRVVIEGRSWGPSPAEVKQQVAESIQDAAQKMPGAEVLYVTTRHRDVETRVRTGVPVIHTEKQSRHQGGHNSPKPGSHGLTHGTSNPYKPGSKKHAQWLQMAATRGAAKRLGWPEERLQDALAQIEQGMPPQRMRPFKEIVAERARWGMQRPQSGRIRKRTGRPPKPDVELSQSPEAVRMRRMRERQRLDRLPRKPRGVDVVETLPNGDRMLSDGSKLKLSGKRISAEGLANMRRTALLAREARQRLLHPERKSAEPSFPEPSALSEAPEQGVQHRHEPPATETNPITVRKGGGLVRKIMGWHSTEPAPVQDLPDLTSADWWDNLIRAYLRPDCDAEALIKNNHVTVAQFDQELERRGIRRYSTRTLPEGVPGRLH